jgi:hypothetical protein
MLSRHQFEKANEFLIQYQDALRCVESIAERRQGYDHYETTTAALVSGMEHNQLSL